MELPFSIPTDRNIVVRSRSMDGLISRVVGKKIDKNLTPTRISCCSISVIRDTVEPLHRVSKTKLSSYRKKKQKTEKLRKSVEFLKKFQR